MYAMLIWMCRDEMIEEGRVNRRGKRDREREREREEKRECVKRGKFVWSSSKN
jgi:hypothetical protein